MALVKFNDRCIISRSLGVDDADNEPFRDIYNGECNYQQGTLTNAEIPQRNSVVFIPYDVLSVHNDVIAVTLKNGQVREGKVLDVRNIEMPLTGKQYTRVVMEYDSDNGD